jgi:DNA-directed RNA polymerase alpha subunit
MIMTQRDIEVMDIIVDKIANSYHLSSALKFVYNKRHVCIPYDEAYFDVPIVALNMSMRTTNALLRSNLNNIGDVIKFCNSRKITSIPNLGKTSGIELFEAILNHCWDHMSQEKKEAFLIDTVERNSDNIRADIA